MIFFSFCMAALNTAHTMRSSTGADTMVPIFFRLFTGCMLQIFPYSVLCTLPFRGSLRYSSRKTGIFTVLLTGSVCCLFAVSGSLLASTIPDGQLLYQLVNTVFMAGLVPCLAWYIYAVRTVWQKKLFVLSFALTSALLVTSATNCITTWYYTGKPYEYLPYYGIYNLLNLIVTCVFLPLLWLILRKWYLPVSDGMSRRETGYLAVLSLILFVLLCSGLTFIDYIYLVDNPMALFLYGAVILLVFVVYAIAFYLYHLTHERNQLQLESLRMEQQIALQNEQYRRIHETIEINRRLRHDLMHHMRTLHGYLQAGESGQAEAYLADYLSKADRYEIRKLCNDPVVNMMVSHYQDMASQQNIRFTARIDLPDELKVAAPDLSVLLGNLLENAITAAAKAEGNSRFIRFHMLCSGSMLAITCDNGFDGVVRMDGTHYLSTCENHSGLGLKNLTYIAEKYDGGVEFTHEGNVFHASVMLGLAI